MESCCSAREDEFHRRLKMGLHEAHKLSLSTTRSVHTEATEDVTETEFSFSEEEEEEDHHHHRVHFIEECNQVYDSPYVILKLESRPHDHQEDEDLSSSSLDSPSLPCSFLPEYNNEIIKTDCWYKRSEIHRFKRKNQQRRQRAAQRHQWRMSCLEEDYQAWLVGVNGMVWDFIVS